MELITHIVFIKKVKKGEAISYGRLWTAPRDTTVATLPIGYADGLDRSLSGRAEVLIRGKRYPLVGRICMDQCMVDVTHIPGVEQGDEVTLIGRQGEDELTAQAVAARLGTSAYEVVSALLARVPRLS